MDEPSTEPSRSQPSAEESRTENGDDWGYTPMSEWGMDER